MVALTFDAGANSAGLPGILQTLAATGVRGTFFLTGNWAAANPAGVAAIVAGGHRLGNHSMTHPGFTGLPDAAIGDQLSGAEQAIRAGGGDPRPLFRFPFGERDARTIATVNAYGYLPVRWTVDTLGWKGSSGGITAQIVADRVLAGLRPGEIVLMHIGSNPNDGTTLDADALPGMIERIRAGRLRLHHPRCAAGMTESPTLAAALAPVDAVIFDLDGVVTDTAELRAAAWKQLFDAVLQDPRLPAGTRRDPFSTEDYLDLVAGRTWEDAVSTFLRSRGGAIPDGSPSDGPGEWTAFGLAARQNELFDKLLSTNPVRAFPGTADLLGRLKAGRIPVVLATSARNAGALLAAAGLGDAFDHVIDGQTALERDVAGKPAPALPLEAVRRLEIPPARAMVIEESVTGVEAGRRGGFGLVVGIDRAGRRDPLEAAGADVVVEDVSQLDIGLVITHPWLLVYEGFDPAHEGHREALTTLGNGYLATRGAAPEHRAGAVHYPGSYLAGVYNSLHSVVLDQESDDEHMVNIPDWLPLDLRIGDGAWWSEGGLSLRSERRTLDLKRARADPGGAPGGRRRPAAPAAAAPPRVHGRRRTSPRWKPSSRRSAGAGASASAAAATRTSPTPMSPRTRRCPPGTWAPSRRPPPGPARAPPASRWKSGPSPAGSGSPWRSGPRCPGPDGPAAAGIPEQLGGLHTHRFELSVDAGEPLTVLKTVAVASSRDHAIASPLAAARAALARAPDRFRCPAGRARGRVGDPAQAVRH